MRCFAARARGVGYLAAFIVAGSCAGTNDSDHQSTIARTVPAKLSNARAWSLFDRSVSDGFTPDEQPVSIDFDRTANIVALKVHGPAPYLLDVRGTDGVSLGFGAVNLSMVAPGWHTFRAESPSATSHVELRFRPLGPAKPIAEIELWATDDLDPSSGAGPASRETTLSFAASENTKELEPGDCNAFAIELDRPPSVFRQIDLVYGSSGPLRGFSLERSINGHAAIGGAWMADDTGQARTFSEQLDPAELQLGHNEVRICVPSSANRLVNINELRLVGELDRGNRLPVRATLEGGVDAAALLDEDFNTTVALGAGQRVVLDFDHLIAPDALVVTGDALPTRVDCISQNGAVLSISTVDIGDALRLDGGTKACRGVVATFASAATLSSLDVVGSGAEEIVDWPHLVITSPGEHFGRQAWIGGYVARPRLMTGAIRVSMSDEAIEGKTGAFGRLITRGRASGPWTVDVKALYPDGTQDIRKIALDVDRAGDLLASPQARGTAATDPNETRYGKAGASAVADARRDVTTDIRLGTRVGINIPVGAVTHPTTIKANHLAHDALPPLDPGMINVVPRQSI